MPGFDFFIYYNIQNNYSPPTICWCRNLDLHISWQKETATGSLLPSPPTVQRHHIRSDITTNKQTIKAQPCPQYNEIQHLLYFESADSDVDEDTGIPQTGGMRVI